jgi:CRP-like cAMP-binding protein
LAYAHKPGTGGQEPDLMETPDAGRWDNRLIAALPREALALLERDIKQVTLALGAVCFEPGDVIDQIYFPLTGMISLLVATGDGEMVETTMIGREGAVGLQRAIGDRRSFTRAIVQIPGKFSTISAARFAQVAANNPALRELVFRYTEILWTEAQQMVACNAVHDSSSRLCRWLLLSADRTGGNQLTLTQEVLAEMLGVRRTTVTLLAQDLQKQGILSYSRGKITLLDRDALVARACECYHVIKDESLSLKIGAAT